MKDFLYNFSGLYGLIPIKLYIRLTKQYLICPFYHAVSDIAPEHLKYLYPVRNTRQFEKDLDFLTKHFNPVDYSFLTDALHHGKTIRQKSFLLTFDDGLREFHDVIAPVLIRKGIPATCFINSSFTDNQDMFFRFKASIIVNRIKNTGIATTFKITEILNNHFKNRVSQKRLQEIILSIGYGHKQLLDEIAAILEIDFKNYLQQHKPYLTKEQINSLMIQGFTFGAHSTDHPKYMNLSLTQQVDNTRKCIEYINSNFRQPVNMFSFPFTDFGVDKRFFDAISKDENGHVDLSFGCAGLKKDTCHFNFQRIPMEIKNFKAGNIISTEYLYYIMKSILNKNIIYR